MSLPIWAQDGFGVLGALSSVPQPESAMPKVGGGPLSLPGGLGAALAGVPAPSGGGPLSGLSGLLSKLGASTGTSGGFFGTTIRLPSTAPTPTPTTTPPPSPSRGAVPVNPAPQIPALPPVQAAGMLGGLRTTYLPWLAGGAVLVYFLTRRRSAP